MCYEHSKTGNVVVKLTSFNNYLLEDRAVCPTGPFKISPDSFYVTDSPFTVTSIEKLASLNDYSLGDGPC